MLPPSADSAQIRSAIVSAVSHRETQAPQASAVPLVPLSAIAGVQCVVYGFVVLTLIDHPHNTYDLGLNYAHGDNSYLGQH